MANPVFAGLCACLLATSCTATAASTITPHDGDGAVRAVANPNYYAMPLGWDLSTGNHDLEHARSLSTSFHFPPFLLPKHPLIYDSPRSVLIIDVSLPPNDDIPSQVGPCNNSAPYVPPDQVLSLCDGMPACTATNYVPVQPGSNARCAWLKTNGANDRIAAFVHRRRCNGALNATVVASPGNRSRYKFCASVGDAFYDVVRVVPANGTLVPYARCMAMCDGEPRCAACQTDGATGCTLLTVHTSAECGESTPGCSAWFRVF